MAVPFTISTCTLSNILYCGGPVNYCRRLTITYPESGRIRTPSPRILEYCFAKSFGLSQHPGVARHTHTAIIQAKRILHCIAQKLTISNPTTNQTKLTNNSANSVHPSPTRWFQLLLQTLAQTAISPALSSPTSFWMFQRNSTIMSILSLERFISKKKK